MADRLYLGEKCIYENDIEKTRRNGNCLIAGGTGSGKTYSVTMPALTHMKEENMIVTCAKRLVPEMFRKSLEKRGYRVAVIDLSSPADSPEGFDILRSVVSYRSLSDLADAVVFQDDRKRTSNNLDPFFDQAAFSLMCAEIMYTLMTVDDPTFADVIKIHDATKITSGEDELIMTSLDEAFDRLSEKHPDNPVRGWYKTFRDLAPRTAGCVSGSLSAVINRIFSEDLRKMIKEKESFDPDRLIKEKTALFIIVSPVETSGYAYAGLIYSALIKHLFEAAEKMPFGRLRYPIRMICDDFALTPISRFPDYISVFRACGISATLLVQDISQLKQTYQEEGTRTIINNCDQLVYMGGMDRDTITEFAQRCDLPFSDVQGFEIGKEVVIRRGDGCIFDTNYGIFSDREFLKIKEEYEKEKEKER